MEPNMEYQAASFFQHEWICFLPLRNPKDCTFAIIFKVELSIRSQAHFYDIDREKPAGPFWATFTCYIYLSFYNYNNYFFFVYIYLDPH
jgi:hypothetical protein